MVDSLPHLLAGVDPYESFYIGFDHGSGRAVAITLPTVLELYLEKLIKLYMREDKHILSEYFKPDGILGGFGNKAKLAYMLRIIDKSKLHDFTLIGKIRNRFAHDIDCKDFENSVVKGWVKSLHMYAAIKGIAEKELAPGLEKDAYDLAFMMKGICTVAVDTTELSYKECVRWHVANLVYMLQDAEKGIIPNGRFVHDPT